MAEFLAQEKKKDEYQRKDEDAHPCPDLCLPSRCRKVGFIGRLGEDCQKSRANQIAFNLAHCLVALGHGQAQGDASRGQ
jgi:hypothetical protein